MGFTLVELLTVIAIIAVLAAILFPVFNAVREGGRQANCRGNCQQIIQAVNMYKEDWKVYPDALYGYQPVGPNENCPTGIPNGIQLAGLRLFPEYVKDEKVFHCPNAPFKTNVRDTTLVVNRMTGLPHQTPFFRYCYYAWDSYDLNFRPGRPGSPQSIGTPELHYTRKWSGLQGLADDRRQVIYRNPPDSTVITWCLYHSRMDPNGNPGNNEQAIVGFLNGRIQSIPAVKLANWPAECINPGANTPPQNCPWQVDPKP